MIFWRNQLRKRGYHKKLTYELKTVYSFKYNQLEETLGGRYYLVRRVIEWIIRSEHELSKQDNINYSRFLENYHRKGKLPSFLIQMLSLIAKDPEGQSILVKRYDLEMASKEKMTSLTIFFGLLESALLDTGYKSSKAKVKSHLGIYRNSWLNQLREAIIEWRKENEKIAKQERIRKSIKVYKDPIVQTEDNPEITRSEHHDDEMPLTWNEYEP